MGKVVIVAVAALLLGTAGLYGLDVEDSPVAALVFPSPVTPTPSYVPAIGTPAAVALPAKANFDTWFKDDPQRDPYDVTTWKEVVAFLAETSSTTGWAEGCKAVGGSAGSDRTKEPLLGALACSDDPSVTSVQRFALLLLGARAHTALWMRDVPGYNTAGIEARLAQVANDCAAGVAARDAVAGSPFVQACTLAADTSYRTGDGASTFKALGEAYALIAAEIARRDPSIDAAAGSFDSAPTPAP